MAVSTHALAECYATLTVLQVRPPISPGQAQHLIETNILGIADVVPLKQSDCEEALGRMTRLGLTSGAVYDALHVVAAEKINADQLLTFNGRDFRRMPPEDPTDLVIL
jgi:predicted nucleic acid-binding protein